MTRPRRVGGAPATVTIAASSPEGSGENGDGPDAQTVDALNANPDDGQKQPRARVTRWNEGMRTYATLDTVSAEVIDEEWIQKEYGGGKYRVYFWGTMKNGTYGYLPGAGKEFVIDDSVPFKGALKHRAATGPVHNSDGTPAGAPAAGASLVDMGMLQLFTTMQENSRMSAAMQADHSKAMMAMMQQMVAQPRGNGMVEILGVLGPLLAPLLTGVVNRKDPVELATQIAALSRSEKSGIGSLHELIELKDTLAILGGNGGDSEEGGWMRILEKVVPGAIDILKNESAKSGTPLIQLARTPATRITAPATATLPASTSRPPASASSVDAPSPSPADMPAADEWTPLEPYVAQLAHFAQINKPPFQVMNMVLTLAPEAMIGSVRELVSHEEALEFLVGRFPVLANYRDWTGELLDEFYNHFHPDEEEDPPADPAAEEPAV